MINYRTVAAPYKLTLDTSGSYPRTLCLSCVLQLHGKKTMSHKHETLEQILEILISELKDYKEINAGNCMVQIRVSLKWNKHLEKRVENHLQKVQESHFAQKLL